MKRLLLLASCILATSCITQLAIPSTFKEESDFVLDKNYSKEVGETLLESYSGYFLPAIVLTEDVAIADNEKTWTAKKDQIFVHRNSTQNRYLLYSPGTIDKGIAFNKQDSTATLFFIYGAGPEFFDTKEKPAYRKIDYPDDSKTFFKQHLIYNGKAGSAIKFTYREYADNLARPAFTQDLTYDLSESDTIGFKGLRIKVAKATNTNIEYRILSGFTQ